MSRVVSVHVVEVIIVEGSHSSPAFGGARQGQGVGASGGLSRLRPVAASRILSTVAAAMPMVFCTLELDGVSGWGRVGALFFARLSVSPNS